VPEASRFDLSGRVALVTGASRGIGSAIATALAEQGARVVLSSRKQADLDAEADRINARFPERAVAIAAHAGKPEDLQRLVDEVMARFARIDILVNNAATNPYFGPVLGADAVIWDKTFEVNVRGMFLLTKLVYEASMEKRGGVVINVASVGGLKPGLGLGIYNITKAAVIMLTRQLAHELGGKVRVNAVINGAVESALWRRDPDFASLLKEAGDEIGVLDRIDKRSIPLVRCSAGQDVLRLIRLLLSDDSTISGATLAVDGAASL
jgi:NAD(P)-dependent dehydrogenase (short-subunit alcohol dehydrogenase family)